MIQSSYHKVVKDFIIKTNITLFVVFTLYSVLGLDQVHSQVASRHYTTDYWSVAVCALCYAMGIII